MSDSFLYEALPYLAVLLAVGVPLYRRYQAQLREWVRRQAEQQGSDTDALALGLGAAIVGAGHVVGLLVPRAVILWGSSPLRLAIMEVTGLVGGLLLAWGLVRGLTRRVAAARATGAAGWAWLGVHALLLAEVLNGLYLAATLRWASLWSAHTLAPWLRSLLALQPDATLVAQLPLSVRLHLLGGLLLLVAVPLARALEASQPLAAPQRAPATPAEVSARRAEA